MFRKQTVVAIFSSALALVSVPTTAFAQDATPTTLAADQCGGPTPAAGTPEAAADGLGGMTMSTPAVMEHLSMDRDQMYIDMMIPHHDSIIAMAEAALPRLSDRRLRSIAQDVVATQQPEIDELQEFRAGWYGDAAPLPLDGAKMAAMAAMMPEMSGTLDEMTFQMDAAAQVAAICASDNPDITFIDLTIPHHRMAIEASRAILDHPSHPELRAFAQRVIDAQQREIDELTAIREELTGEATPAA